MTFNDLPIPPSSNNQYLTLFRKGRVIHVPSAELKKYRIDMKIRLEQLRAVVEPDLKLKKFRIWTCFYFERTRLFTKANTVKRLDVSNRLKALHDCLCEFLDIDDCQFFHLLAGKLPVPNKAEERVDVWLETMSEQDLRNSGIV